MCERCEKSVLQNKSKLTFQQIGQSLGEELKMQDKMTAEEENMIMQDCERKLGTDFFLYEQIDCVLDKILQEVKNIHQERSS